MSTYTFYTFQPMSGRIQSNDVVYATAREGAGFSVISSTLSAGQTSAYACSQAFIAFDTQGIGTDENVTAATLYLTGLNDISTTDFTIEARETSWVAAPVVAGDWIAGSALGSGALLASMNSSGYSTATDGMVLTSESGFPAYINRSGYTEIVLCSDRHRLGTVPTGDEMVNFRNETMSTAGRRARLDVTTDRTDPNAPLSQPASSPMRY